MRKRRATWEDLLAPPQEPARPRQPEPTQTQQRRPRRKGSDAFKTKVQQALPQILAMLFFPSIVFEPVAMLVPIFGGAMAALIWVFLISAVAQLMD